MHFLIVDDLEGSRSTLRLTLSTFGVTHTMFAVSGVDAMRRLDTGHYDVILCDYVLGDGKDGQQVLEEIRYRNLISRSTVFVMLTAERGYQKVINAVELSPDDYLIKPFNGETLMLRLSRAIEKKIHFKEVYERIDKSDFEAAIQECDNNIEAKSHYTIDFLRLKAELLLLAGRPDEARKIYEMVLATRSIPWAKMGMGKALYQQKQYDQAQETFIALTEENEAYVGAYDWLAKTYESKGETTQAQDVVQQALDISPNAVVRHKKLGELAFVNNDLETAEKAFRTSISMGKHSVYRNPDDYVGLSKTLMGKGDHDQALDTLKSLGNEFKDAAASLQGATTKSLIYKDMGNEDDAQAALDEAKQLYEANKGELSGKIVTTMAETCLHFGENDAADAIIRELAQTSHGDDALLDNVTAMYKQFGMEERAQQTIQEGGKAAVQLNNEAVIMAREGKLEEAITLLRQAADKKSASITVTLNAAHVILLYLEKNGWGEVYGSTARMYLRKARDIDANNPKYAKISKLFKDITHKFGVRYEI
jgi:tetratricopeptide (TPR) repeat protein